MSTKYIWKLATVRQNKIRINKIMQMKKMVIQASFVMPHGLEVVDRIFPDQNEKWKRLTNAMREIGKKIYALQPDVVIIASPHNLRIKEHIGIINTEHLSGDLLNAKTNESVTLDVQCDRDFAETIYEKAKEKILPVTLINYGALEGPMSWLPMDWGTAIPLFFVWEEYQANNKDMPPIVLITPTRGIPWEQLIALGETIAEVTNELNKKAVFIASADHGHAHLEDGPYGYDPASKEYDEKVIQLIENNELEKLLEFAPEFLEQAKPDSFWQLLMLLGCLKITGLKCTSCVYECPSYYGMAVATFE